MLFRVLLKLLNFSNSLSKKVWVWYLLLCRVLLKLLNFSYSLSKMVWVWYLLLRRVLLKLSNFSSKKLSMKVWVSTSASLASVVSTKVLYLNWS